MLVYRGIIFRWLLNKHKRNNNGLLCLVLYDQAFKSINSIGALYHTYFFVVVLGNIINVQLLQPLQIVIYAGLVATCFDERMFVCTLKINNISCIIYNDN